MNLIVAIFIYLGLATSAETVITDQDILIHQEEINRVQNDPSFYEFLEDIGGVGQIDIESGV
ncbi:MAG: hypothetical protein IPN95_18460 [Bacteroidetes bacterium]|nr:hypothetical protein [Bacteroidota bacterium]MBP6639678.1 hypothetical protein [Bacteroidia bacterium]MBP8074141.1 hypothetical protein [Bacteroidia bacterium]